MWLSFSLSRKIMRRLFGLTSAACVTRQTYFRGAPTIFPKSGPGCSVVTLASSFLLLANARRPFAGPASRLYRLVDSCFPFRSSLVRGLPFLGRIDDNSLLVQRAFKETLKSVNIVFCCQRKHHQGDVFYWL
jgi:hypothetical protein